ncbi:hypothetical protein EL22_04960 [Halostagnicola sp. A56]|uniref:hypothetical protein n=1 Tax=Halostagnicola sp. A56 TaxID=1495067 RepID=UPI00049FE047|nr:hypothetical protein [Halostagnicola sp. A56]KDE60261.1 hypothetical protein EL22_04960 [Halostagnicola sp. A56]
MVQSDDTTESTDETETATVPAHGGDGDSIVDLAQQPIVKQWTKFVAILFAFAGVGAGLVVIFRDIVDQPIIDSSVVSAQSFPGVDVPIVAALVAVFIGVYFGWTLQTDDRTAYLTSAIAMWVGTITCVILFVIFYSIGTDLSIDFGGLIVSSIVSGLGPAVAGAGGAWTSRTATPEHSSTTAEPRHHVQTSD